MKTTLYLDGKKTTRKHVAELIGKDRLDRIIKASAQSFRRDPLTQNDFWIGRHMLTVEFSD